jgi:hypothetical protein
VKLQAAFLAETALGNADGTFMVWRAGITDMNVSVFPAPMQFTLVLRLEADRAEAGQLHHLQMKIIHAGIEVGPWQKVPLAFPEPADFGRSYLNMLSRIQMVVSQPGEGFIEAIVDDGLRIPHLYFRVVHRLTS